MHVLSEHQGVTLGSDMQPDDDYKVLLLVMTNVFVVIRAAEKYKEDSYSRGQYSTMCLLGWLIITGPRISRGRVYSRAADFDCEKYVDAMFTSVRSASK